MTADTTFTEGCAGLRSFDNFGRMRNFTVTTGRDGIYRKISYKLHDAGKIDRLTLNGVEKNLTDNAWSDLNFITPGAFGAVAGENTLVVYDVAGNTQTIVFTLAGAVG